MSEIAPRPFGTRKLDRLAATLAAAREEARLSGKSAGTLVGMGQPKISKLETGRLIPNPSDVDKLLRAYGASPQVLADAVQLAREIGELRYRAPKLVTGLDDPRVAALEERAPLLRVAALAGLRSLPNALQGREVCVIMSQWASRRPDQKALLKQARKRPDVQITILPDPFIGAGAVGFRIFDEASVVVEMLTSGLLISNLVEVSAYIRQFAQFLENSLTMDEMIKKRGTRG